MKDRRWTKEKWSVVVCDVRFLSRIQGSQNSIFKIIIITISHPHLLLASLSPLSSWECSPCLTKSDGFGCAWCPQSPCVEVIEVCLSQGLCSHKWGRCPYKICGRGHPGFLRPFCQVRTQQLAASCRQRLFPETSWCLGLCSLCSCVVTHLPTPHEERRGDRGGGEREEKT